MTVFSTPSVAIETNDADDGGGDGGDGGGTSIGIIAGAAGGGALVLLLAVGAYLYFKQRGASSSGNTGAMKIAQLRSERVRAATNADEKARAQGFVDDRALKEYAHGGKNMGGHI